MNRDMCHAISSLVNRPLRVKSWFFVVYILRYSYVDHSLFCIQSQSLTMFFFMSNQYLVDNCQSITLISLCLRHLCSAPFLQQNNRKSIFFRWYAGKIPRNRAERLVLQGTLPRGTFLIREREGDTG